MKIFKAAVLTVSLFLGCAAPSYAEPAVNTGVKIAQEQAAYSSVGQTEHTDAGEKTVDAAAENSSFTDKSRGITLFYPADFAEDKNLPGGDNILLASSRRYGALLSVSCSKLDNVKSLSSEQQAKMLRIRENIVKEKQYKILTSGIMFLDGNIPAMHIAFAKSVAVNDKNYVYVQDEFSFTANGYSYNVTYQVPEIFYGMLKRQIISAIQKTRFSELVKLVNLENFPYSYEIIGDSIVFNDKYVGRHIFLAINRSYLTGVIVQPLTQERYYYWPKSLANLSAEEKSRLEENYTQEIISMPKSKVSNIKFTYLKLNGHDCLRLDYDDFTSHNTSYIFLKDGRFISFDYMFKTQDMVKIMPLVEKSAATIKLEG